MKTIEERRMVNNNQDTCMDCATHIHDNGDFYKRCDAHELGSWLNFNPTNGFWTKSMMQKGREIELLTEIKPTPTKFVKVEESIFDLKEEFEKGELFTKKAWGEYVLIEEDTHLASLYEMQSHENSKIGIYRQVEITERDLFIDMIEQAGAELSSDGEWSFACLAASVFDSGHIKLTDKPE